jgi:hypothetical protein
MDFAFLLRRTDSGPVRPPARFESDNAAEMFPSGGPMSPLPIIPMSSQLTSSE